MKLEYITSKGDVLLLTNNSRFKLSNVDGITFANVNISSSTVASMDGDFINNKRTNPRSIILDLAIEQNVETVKRYIFNYIKPKQKGILRMEQNDRQVQIEGVVESIEMPRYTEQVIMQIALYCSQPYWEDVEDTVTDISETLDLHYFTDDPNDMLYFPEEGIPFGEYDANRTKAFINDGDVEVGLTIHIVALGHVVNPTIYNSEGAYIGVNVTLESGDEIIITTTKGNKTITLNGANILSKIKEGSTWLQLPINEDEFTIDGDDETEANMYFTIIYKQRYV